MKRCFAVILAAVLAIAWGAAFSEGSPDSTSYPLISGKQTVGTVKAPENFALNAEQSVLSDSPEYYMNALDPESPVRFYYYTVGEGEPASLAAMALESYAVFYDEFSPGEILWDSFAGLDVLRVAYTCAYPDMSGTTMVYEQTAIGYIPLDANSFIACIVSLSHNDASAYWEEDRLIEELEKAVSAITLAGA